MRDLIEAVSMLQKQETVTGIVEFVIGQARACGFAGVFLISPIGRDSREGRILTYDGFDPTWARAYRRWLHRTDPLPEIIFEHPRPFFWRDAAKLRELDNSNRRYLKILEQRGMADGLALPVFGPTARSGLVGLGLHADIASLSDRDVEELRVFFQMAYLRYCEMISEDWERETALSKREMDVLLWMSRGKSNAAIAVILDISTDTVDTYVRRIFKKFEVVDRVGAVTAAIRHGYVIAANYPRFRGPIPPEPSATAVSPKHVTTNS